MNKHKITPHLWFDTQAKEAAEFYVSVFPNSKINRITTIHDVPSPTGDSDSVTFTINEQPFMAISAGPEFTINPSISFFVNFDPSNDQDAEKHLNEIWEKLSDGGMALMPIQEYPFSKLYGWIQDKYGVSWQLMLTNPSGKPRPFIVPSLLFTQTGAGKAEEAIEFYTKIFKDGKRGTTSRYPKGMEPEKEDSIMFADFSINNTWIAAMDSAQPHKFVFNEAISLLIPCDTQEEIDYYWEKLSAVPEAEQCGWLKDKFGVSWQVWPTAMRAMMENGTPEQLDNLTQTFLKMKKFDISKLEEAYNRA